MGKGCLTVCKYFLFLFNVIFFLFGTALVGSGLWLLLDNQSFIVVLNNSPHVKLACYVLIAVGVFSMLLGFLGCLGAIYEVRCLLGLYFTCLLLILLAQVAAAVFIYVQRKTLDDGMLEIVSKVMENYPGNSSSVEQTWDFIQKKMQCCGWRDPEDWLDNGVISSSNQQLFPCSCQNLTLTSRNASDSGFCETPTDTWPVYQVGCAASVEKWFLTNIGVVLGICIAVAFIELIGMILSMCLCKHITSEEYYTPVPKH